MIAQTPAAVAGPPSQHSRVVGTIAPVPSSDLWSTDITDAAQRFAIPETWIRTVIDVADVGDPRVLSARGAIGLMQLMPETWRGLRERHGLGDDPFQPRDNIMAGAAYLRELSERYGSLRAAMTAYHAGPERFEEHLATDFALPADTVAFFAKVVAAIGKHDEVAPAFASATDVEWTDAPLFVAREKSQSDDTIPLAEKSSGTPTRGASAMLTPASRDLFARRSQPDAAQR
ncbi:lytic transglycosylase domain-containing protein [Hyphomicrobium sp.]|uniref:lytic transglycosylase domain-containing protein n=1 Tax=Hyphomicrobium sp. TaxID=82 RepID=UPI002FE1E19D